MDVDVTADVDGISSCSGGDGVGVSPSTTTTAGVATSTKADDACSEVLGKVCRAAVLSAFAFAFTRRAKDFSV